LVLLWFAAGSNYLTRTMLTTMRASILDEIPMTEAQFGLLTSAFLWVYALASPFGGYVADRFSRHLVVIIGLFGWSLITWLTAYAKTFEQFVVLRALLGLSQACYIPAGVALIIDYHRGSTRALATGIHATGMILGSTIGGVAGWIAETQGWRFAYTSIGLPNLALGVVLCFFLRESPREHVAEPVAGGQPGKISFVDAMRSLSTTGPFYFLICSWCLQGAIAWIIIGWMPTHLKETYGMGQGSAGMSALGYVFSAQLVGLLVGGAWSDRWSAKQPHARLFLPIIVLLCAAPVFMLMGWSHLIIFVILSLLMWGLAAGFMGANMMPIICLIVNARYRATALGVLNCFTAIAGGLGIYGVGALRDAKIGIAPILTFAGLGVFLCAGFLWLVHLALNRVRQKTGHGLE
jgi:MFS family permease